MRKTLIWFACALAAGISLVWMVLAGLAGSDRFLSIARTLDRAANAALGGSEMETISARCWRHRDEWPYSWLRPCIDWLFADDPEHCRTSFEAERRRAGEFLGSTQPLRA